MNAHMSFKTHNMTRPFLANVGTRTAQQASRISRAFRNSVITQAVDEKKDPLISLDALLGTELPAQKDGELVSIWSLKPKQDAPPRQKAMASGQEGRFMTNQYFETVVRAGRPTAAGDEYELPRVQPVLSYAALLVNLAVFGTYVQINTLMGSESSQEFLSGILPTTSLITQGESWRLLTSTLVHSGPLHLLFSLYGLATVAPAIEAVLGYLPFVAAYLMSAVSSTTLCYLLSDADASEPAGASGAVLSLAVILLAHRLQNKRAVGSAGKGAELHAAVLSVSAAVLCFAVPEESGFGGLSVPMVVGGLVSGVVFGYGMIPKYEVSVEIEIPDGSMVIPEDAKETTVVIDQTTMVKRAGTSMAYALLLTAMVSGGMFLKGL